jgi:tRNA-dihydrouridine synthase
MYEVQQPCCDGSEWREEGEEPAPAVNAAPVSVLEGFQAHDGGEGDQRVKDFYKEQSAKQRRMMAEEKREIRRREFLRRQGDLKIRKKQQEVEDGEMRAANPVADRVKLIGYDWFESIGSPKYIVAPMVDQSELAYRMLTRRHGATLVYTQMFNSNNFCHDASYRRANFDTCYGDRPLIVQFCGHDPEKLLASALYVQDHCDAVDINLGCPQAIAKRGRYGAFLMEELDLLTAMVSALAKGLKIPVTCKTRIYHDFERSVRLCETLVAAGASLLTIHGRTREEKGQAVRQCNWETLRRLKEHFKGRVPIIANGGIHDMDDVEQCLATTGCDGVMTSEGILENPAIFARNIKYEDVSVNAESNSGADFEEKEVMEENVEAEAELPPANKVPVKYMTQLDIAEEYLDLCSIYPTWHFRTMRSHMQKFLHRYLQKHTNIRDMVSISISVDEFRLCLVKIKEALAEETLVLPAANAEDVDVKALKLSAVEQTYANNSWYMRHRTGEVHPHATAAEVRAKLNQRHNILDTETEDYGFSIFDH